MCSRACGEAGRAGLDIIRPAAAAQRSRPVQLHASGIARDTNPYMLLQPED